MSSMSTCSTSRRLPISYRLSTYLFMFLKFKLFIRNNRLLFLDEVISGKLPTILWWKDANKGMGHTFQVCISKLWCLKIYTHEVAHKVFASTKELQIVPIIFFMMTRLWREFIWLSMWLYSFIMHTGNDWWALC